jgi:predicted nucleotidyltransferase
MRREEEPAFLRRPLERLIRAFAPIRIVLFGSHAKGEAQPGSDVDLLVIAELTGDRAVHLRRARQLVAPSFPPIDVVLHTPEEVAEAPTAASPFLSSVLESGVVVYSRPTDDPARDSDDGATTPP